ncbi:hypothetical protein GCM10027262_01900 [Nocardia tengchongensis]
MAINRKVCPPTTTCGTIDGSATPKVSDGAAIHPLTHCGPSHPAVSAPAVPTGPPTAIAASTAADTAAPELRTPHPREAIATTITPLIWTFRPT